MASRAAAEFPAAYPAVPPVGAEGAALALLRDLAARKEFRAVGEPPPGPEARRAAAAAPGFRGPAAAAPPLFLPGLRLNGAQNFVRNLAAPDTRFSRLLVNWQTGTGKSIAAVSIAQEYVRQFQARAALGERAPAVHVVSFTGRETIQEDMLRFPEFGFASAEEVAEVRRLRAAAAADPDAAEARNLPGLMGALRRRITDRARGGFYRFYGYKEFAGLLFAATPAGAAAGFDPQALYRGEGGAEAVAAAVARGEARVNEALLADLRGALLVADEIHNAYNSQEKNNYGVALQYVLDALGADAPRAVFMSATPMTGSAAEVVDLLNLLVPRAELPGGGPLRRGDFFAARPGGGSALLPGAAARIAALAAGRVSFLLDSDVESYPRRLFEGEAAPGVPYLRFDLCEMAPFHARTLAAALRDAEGAGGEPGGLSMGALALLDLAFPNPAGAADAAAGAEGLGLYRSGETPQRLAAAPEEWRAAAGVSVVRGAAAGVPADTYVISGPFLGPALLPRYSTKYARLAAAAVAVLRAGPGKLMVYHHRVRTSGVLLLQEVFRMHGFADETSAPTDATLCSVCGVPRGEHAGAGADGAAEGHAFRPARFVVAHSDIDRALMLRSLARFNAPSNLDGHEYRAVIGSKVIREGLTFRAVRHQFIAALPTDFPTLVQVFGRAVRKGSHADLPEAERDVRVRIFVSVWPAGPGWPAGPAPELRRYAEKGREYLEIQEVEVALRAGAVDGFANAARIGAALGAPADRAAPSLDGLPFAAALGPGAAAALPRRDASFLAYGHADREVGLLAAVCRALFAARPVWTYADLWAAVRSGAVRNTGYAAAEFDEGNFALALASLAAPAGRPPAVVVPAGPFFVAAPAGPDGAPRLDIEALLRPLPPLPPPARAPLGAPPAPPARPRVAVRVADFFRGARAGLNFAVRLREFAAAFLGGGGVPLEAALLEVGADFHFELLRRLAEAAAAPGPAPPVTPDDARVADLYRRFRIAVTAGAAARGAAAASFRGGPPGAPPETIVGYFGPEAAHLYQPPEGGRAGQWYNAPLGDFGVGRRHTENDLVVGFVVSLSAAEGGGARFKLREPVQKIWAAARARAAGPKRADARALARGAVCETRSRPELEAYATRLRAAVRAAGHGVVGGRPRLPPADEAPADEGAEAAEPEEPAETEPAEAEPAEAEPAEAEPAEVEPAGASSEEMSLRREGARGARSLAARLSYAAQFDRAAQKRFPSAARLCDTIRYHLLAMEEAARAPAQGMQKGLRWLYLFNETPPTITALAAT